MDSLVKRATSFQITLLVGILIFIGTGIIFINHYVTAKNMVAENDVILGRDFIAFYIAGSIINQNNGKNLYHPKRQEEIQSAIIAPETTQGVAFFVNPAPTAILYTVFASLPYLTAFYLHTALMALFFIAAFYLLKTQLTDFLTTHQAWWATLFIAISWRPVQETILGGQNAPLCLLLLTLCYIAIINKKQIVAGVALGLLLFKPQYALPYIGLLLIKKQYTTVVTATLLGIGQYIMAALYCGWDWPVKMMHFTFGVYKAGEALANGKTHISFIEALNYSVISPLEKAAANETLILCTQVAGYLFVLLMILYLMWQWYKNDIHSPDFALHWAIAGALMLYISPHTQYYDVTLLLLPLLLILNYQVKTHQIITDWQRIIMIIAFLGYPHMKLASELIGFQPIFILPLIIVIWGQRRLRMK